MVNFDDKKERNPNWPQTLDNPYRILILGSSVSEKKMYNVIY